MCLTEKQIRELIHRFMHTYYVCCKEKVNVIGQDVICPLIYDHFRGTQFQYVTNYYAQVGESSSNIWKTRIKGYVLKCNHYFKTVSSNRVEKIIQARIVWIRQICIKHDINHMRFNKRVVPKNVNT